VKKQQQQHQMMRRIDDFPSVKNDPDGFEARNRKSRLDLYPLKSTSECPIILRDKNGNETDSDESTSSTIISSAADDGNKKSEWSKRKKQPFLKRKSLASPSTEEIRRVFQESEHVYPKVLAMSDLVDHEKKFFDPFVSQFSQRRKPPSRIELRNQQNLAEKLIHEQELELNKKRKQEQEKRRKHAQKLAEVAKRVASSSSAASPSPKLPRASSARNNDEKSISIQSIASSKAKIQDAIRKIQTQRNVVTHWSNETQKNSVQNEKSVAEVEEKQNVIVEEEPEQEQIVLSSNSILKPLPQMNFSSSFFAPPKIISQKQQPLQRTSTLPPSLLTKENLDRNETLVVTKGEEQPLDNGNKFVTSGSTLRQLPPPPTNSYFAVKIPVVVSPVKQQSQKQEESTSQTKPRPRVHFVDDDKIKHPSASSSIPNRSGDSNLHHKIDSAHQEPSSTTNSSYSSSSSSSSNTTAGTASPPSAVLDLHDE
jgi:hypothetical protein